MNQKSPLVRAITVGNNINPSNYEKQLQELNEFLHLAKNRFKKENIEVRSLRCCSQPLNELVSQKELAQNPNWLVEFAKKIEKYLEKDVWFCLAGLRLDSPSSLFHSMDSIPEMLKSTQNIFTNAIISSEKGINIAAIKKAGKIVKKISGDKNCFENWRFGIVANTPPNTPYFPGAYHEGKKGFSIALELSEVAIESFSTNDLFEAKLEKFRNIVQKIVNLVNSACLQLEIETGFEFKGIDLSLASFPGEKTSAVKALEFLCGSKIGSLNFLFSVYAMNDLLQHGINGVKKTGYSGTMLSVLEDSALAEQNSKQLVSVKDILLYSGVCGCGVDMVPLPGSVSEEQLSSIILAACTLAAKWNKPLITRLIPVHQKKAGEMTEFSNEYIANTKILKLEEESQRDFLPAFFVANYFEDKQNYELSALRYEAVEAAAPQEKAMLSAAVQELSMLVNSGSKPVVLDVCCGTGNFIGELAEKIPFSGGVGVDVNLAYLDFAQNRFKDKTISFEHGDAVFWKSDKKFDIVLLGSAYHHIEDERKPDFLKNVLTHLKEDGFAVFAENILPRYNNSIEYKDGVRLFYEHRTEDAKKHGVSSQAVTLLERIMQFGVDREYEYKVDFPRFKKHLKEAGFEIILKKRVWGKRKFLDDAGDYVVIARKAKI